MAYVDEWMERNREELNAVMARFYVVRPDFHRSPKNVRAIGGLIRELIDYFAVHAEGLEWSPDIEDVVNLYTTHLDKFESRPATARPQVRFIPPSKPDTECLNCKAVMSYEEARAHVCKPKPRGRGRFTVRRVSESPESDAWLKFFCEEFGLPDNPTSTPVFEAIMRKLHEAV
jgi:hypothetical protein